MRDPYTEAVRLSNKGGKITPRFIILHHGGQQTEIMVSQSKRKGLLSLALSTQLMGTVCSLFGTQEGLACRQVRVGGSKGAEWALYRNSV